MRDEVALEKTAFQLAQLLDFGSGIFVFPEERIRPGLSVGRELSVDEWLRERRLYDRAEAEPFLVLEEMIDLRCLAASRRAADKAVVLREAYGQVRREADVKDLAVRMPQR